MQSIYLSNTSTRDIDLSTLEKYLSKHPEIKLKNYVLQFFYSEGRDSFIKHDQYFISNLGVFIYKNNYNKNALKLFMEDLLSGKDLKELLLSQNTRGQFCLIIYYQNNLKLITDRLGYYPIYYYWKNDIIAFSNSILALAKNNKSTINNLGVAQYLSENYRHITYACCDQNIVNEVKYVDAGTVYTFNGNSFQTEKYFDIRNNLEIAKYKSFSEVLNLAEETLTNNLSFLKNVSGKIHCDITGGVDTRVVLSILEKIGVDFKVGLQANTSQGHVTSQGKFSELNIVKKIINSRNLNFHVFDHNIINENSKLIDEITLFHSNKQTYNGRASYFFNLKEEGTDLMISGLSGTELHRLSYYQYFKKNKELNLDIFLKDYVELVDLMHDNLLNSESYYEHLKTFYNKNLNGIKYKEAKDLASYIDYFAFYRTHFCRYLSLANSFIPFYTPYGDYDFATLMYQTSYDLKKKFKLQRFLLSKLNPKLASLYSTRGFPLTKVNYLNFYKFSRMIGNDIPQQYFSLNQRISSWYGKNFIKFLFKNKKIYYSFFKKKLNGETVSKFIQKDTQFNKMYDLNLVEQLDKIIKKDLPVYDFVDKKKLTRYVKNDCNHNVINRVLNLNQILEYISY